MESEQGIDWEFEDKVDEHGIPTFKQIWFTEKEREKRIELREKRRKQEQKEKDIGEVKRIMKLGFTKSQSEYLYNLEGKINTVGERNIIPSWLRPLM